MAARAVRSATLEFGYVSIPVSLRQAKTNNDLRLDTASADGHALSQKYVDAVTGEDCTARDTWRKGIFESRPDKDDRSTWSDFKEIPKDALDAIKAETKIENFEIIGFLPLDEVPFERATGCYYLTPQRGVGAAAGKPMKLLSRAMAETKSAGVLKLVVKERQYPAVIYEKGGALIVNTLVWAGDFASGEGAEALASAAEPDAKMVAMGVQLIEQKLVGVEAIDSLADDLRPKQEELIEEALAGKAVKPKAAAAAKAPAKDGLEAALEASLKLNKKAKPKAKKEAVTA